jgi:hypothetical protein
MQLSLEILMVVNECGGTRLCWPAYMWNDHGLQHYWFDNDCVSCENRDKHNFQHSSFNYFHEYSTKCLTRLELELRRGASPNRDVARAVVVARERSLLTRAMFFRSLIQH